MTEHVDVLIVGAGISGIGAAVHLQKHCPTKRFVLLERRAAVGGTWDLFRYPGVRSDSDMYTLGFRFKPWTSRKAIADGPAILSYLQETVREHGVASKIRHHHQVLRAAWDSATALWTVEGERSMPGIKGSDADQPATMVPFKLTCNMLFSCGGYYNYDQGYMPDYPGAALFKGSIVHPQHWPQGFDYQGKRIVVIGSGATAVTLVPALCDSGAKHVVMLQRTPTYMGARPSVDKVAITLAKLLPARLAYGVTRWINVLYQQLVFSYARKHPEAMRDRLLTMVRRELGPAYDIKTHFTPPYNPWEQRLCLVPDGDLFRVIRDRQATIVTDHIDSFTETGIRLRSGHVLEADVIVSATGLQLQMLAGMDVVVDGERQVVNQHLLYKGVMFSNVPNLVMWFGYTNASWTLKADLTSEFACRLVNHMDATGSRIVTATLRPGEVESEPFVDFSSGYFARAKDKLPQQGKTLPWKLKQSYLKDIKLLRKGTLVDGTLDFAKPQAPRSSDAAIMRQTQA